MFGGLDDPDESHAAGGHGAVGVALDEMADEGDVVGDADTAGEEEDGAVGVEGVDAAVGAFGEGLEGDAGVHAVLGASEEFVGEAGTATDKERERGFLVGAESVLVGHGDALFVGDDFGGLAPGDGEGVCGPPADSGDVQVDVLAGLEGPRAGEVEGDAQRVTWEGFNDCGSEFAAAVAVDDAGKTCSSLRLLAFDESEYRGGERYIPPRPRKRLQPKDSSAPACRPSESTRNQRQQRPWQCADEGMSHRRHAELARESAP